MAALLTAVALAAGAPGAGQAPRVADGGCSATPSAGLVHCENVLNNSLNNISVHILGH